MNNKITWSRFENINQDVQDAFEDLTRIYFKLVCAKDIDTRLLAKNNTHPGFESDPIECNGERLAFQSKYTSSDVYSLFISSLKVAKDKYTGQVDKIYLFTNKGIDTSCGGYKKIIELGNDIGAKIVFVANKDILDEVVANSLFKNVKSYFFDEHDIDDEWFANQITDALAKQKDKYDRNGFNLLTQDIERVKTLIFENDFRDRLNEVIDYVSSVFKSFGSKQYKYNIKKRFNSEIKTIIKNKVLKDLEEGNVNNISQYFTNIDDAIYKDRESIEKGNAPKTPRQIEYLSYLDDTESVVLNLKSVVTHRFQCSLAKVHIIEGGFGTGKTHLFKYIADNRLQENKRTLLLYGESFTYRDSTLEKEIMDKLNISTISFDSFLNILEAKGERDGESTFLMVDAINECANHQEWKTHLGLLISKINQYKYIKLYISLRDSYANDCLGDNISDLIANNYLTVQSLYGLRSFGGEIQEFFKHYNIRYSEIADDVLELFSRPLLLSLYCKAHEGKDLGAIVNVDRISIINDYIRYEDGRWKDIDPNYPILMFNEVIRVIGNYMALNYSKTIPLQKLTSLLNQEGISFINIEYMEKSDIIETMTDSNNIKIIRFYYEVFMDKAYSDSLFDGDKEKCSNNIVDFIDSEGKFRIVHSAISLLLGRYEKTFGEGVGNIIHRLYIKLEKDVFTIVFDEYLEYLLEQPSIDLKQLLSCYKQYFTSQKSFSLLWNKIINKHNDCSNYDLLDELLFEMTLPQRDYYWTIYINNQYDDPFKYNLRECLETIAIKNYQDVNNSEVVLLIWLLTSSNRELRDYVSKELVKIFTVRPTIISDILKRYLEANDPYIISRLLAATFGAVTLSQTIDEPTMISIASIVYNSIFNKEIVYEDIQVRDYARNIIECIEHKNISLDYDTKKCYPPYGSKPVPVLKVSEVEAFYPPNDYDNKFFYGTHAIASSMTPELPIGKLTDTTLYGDFGRYVFDSKLGDFVFTNEVAERKKIFLYAYYYIVNELGYSNELFTEYDRDHYSFRSRKNATERIGKKYEWLAMFHALARVADNYKLENPDDSRGKPIDYTGTWYPYLRDFDPTQLLYNNDRKYSLQAGLFWPCFSKFDLTDNKWISKAKKCFGVDTFRCIKDENGVEWFAISAVKKDETGSIVETPYQSAWINLTAYLVKKDEVNKIVKSFKDGVYSVLTGGYYETGNYQLYAFDYCWNTSYQGYYANYDTIKIQKPYTVTVKSSKKYKDSHNVVIDLGDNRIIDLRAKGDYHSETRYRFVAEIYRLSHEYMWEAEYDYSKKESIIYEVPSKKLVDILKVHQLYSGVWVDTNNEVILADFSLFNNSNVKGLYVRKDYLLSKIPNDLTIIWNARCELRFIKEEHGKNSGIYIKNALFYYDNKANIKIIEAEEKE